jgi:hypothetical protein
MFLQHIFQKFNTHDFTFFLFAPSCPEVGHRKLWDLREAIHSDSDHELTLPL